MSKQITITFQASPELHGWLKQRAKRQETSLGGYVRFLCTRQRDAVTIARDEFTHEAPANNGRVLTVQQAKRLAGKAPR